MVGYSRKDLAAAKINWKEMTPNQHVPKDVRALEEIRTQGFCRPFEKEYIRKDGSRVSGVENPLVICGRDLLLARRERDTYSAQGATSFPHVGAVSESLEHRLFDSLQFPSAASTKSERLNGSCISQSSSHSSIAGLIGSIKSSARLSRFAVSVWRKPSPGSSPQAQAANRHSLSATALT